MPQTRFVLSKSLKMGLKPIVVLNKIDRPHANPDRVLDMTFDLFTELGATDEQLDFRFCYASGLAGFAIHHLNDPQVDMRPLFELIIAGCDRLPQAALDNPFLMQAATISYDDYVGTTSLRTHSGRHNQKRAAGHPHRRSRRTERDALSPALKATYGLEKVEMEEAGVGDIVILSGIPEVTIGDTFAIPAISCSLPPIKLDEPTVSVDFTVNNSPFVGQQRQTCHDE